MRKEALIKKRGHRCEKCGLDKWLGKDIPLEKHHEKPPSERDEDIRLYCPNCHALTANYRGKAIKTVNSISDTTFKKAANKCKNIRQLLITLGLVPKGGNYATAKTRLQKLGLYDKFQPKSFAKICVNCGVEFWGRGKFCGHSCANKYNQTSANKSSTKWPPIPVLRRMVEVMGYSETGRQLGVSDNGVRKHLQIWTV